MDTPEEPLYAKLFGLFIVIIMIAFVYTLVKTFFFEPNHAPVIRDNTDFQEVDECRGYYVPHGPYGC